MSKKHSETHIDEQWLNRMQEMALRPTDDEQRKQFEAEIAGAEPPIKQAWLSFVYEEEQLRLKLLEVSPPPRLHEHLMAIAESTKRPGGTLRRWFFAAAGVFLLLVLSFGGWWFGHRWNDSHNLHTLALLAINDHVQESRLDIQTHQTGELEKALRDKLGFQPALPNLGQACRLLGGRLCVLGTHPAVYSRWKKADREYTLFQFQPSDFSLPPSIERKLIQPQEPATQRRPCEVMVWAENNKGYILVADHGSMLQDVVVQ